MTAALLAPLPAAAQKPAPSPAEVQLRTKINAAAKEFESQFLSVMMGQMMQGVGEKGLFGGGEGEQAFKSFMADAFGKAIVDRGGVGLAKEISKSMLRRQGLSV